MGYTFNVYIFVAWLWGAVAFVVFAVGAYIYFKRHWLIKILCKNIKSADLYQIDHLPFDQFSALLAKLFEGKGYTVRKVKKEKGEAESIDFLLQKGQRKVAVVVRHTPLINRIGSKAVIQVYTGQEMYRGTEAIVVTNGFFTPNAVETAQDYQVTLYDRYELFRLLSEVRYRRKPAKRRPAITVTVGSTGQKPTAKNETGGAAA